MHAKPFGFLVFKLAFHIILLVIYFFLCDHYLFLVDLQVLFVSLDVSVLADIDFVNIFSYSISCLLTLSMVSFLAQKSLNFM